jgi:hypothetical protein
MVMSENPSSDNQTAKSGEAIETPQAAAAVAIGIFASMVGIAAGLALAFRRKNASKPDYNKQALIDIVSEQRRLKENAAAATGDVGKALAARAETERMFTNLLNQQSQANHAARMNTVTRGF